MINKIKLDQCTIIINNKSISCLLDVIKKINPTKVFILLDKNSKKYCLPILLTHVSVLNSAHILELENGESAKTINSVKSVCNLLLSKNVDRKSLMINLGGGVVSDLGGFVASIIKRGINFINIPTTLMSQVDAAIGGKVAVNFDHYKNQIGLFSSPNAIFIHFPFTNSLSDFELISAYAEILKYGLIYDKLLWENIQLKNINKVNLPAIISKCIRIKVDIVKRDYFDNNERRKLNFGHSISHAIESIFLVKNIDITHGHALFIGLICESYISHKIFSFSPNILDGIVKVIFKYFKYRDIKFIDNNLLLEFIKKDKKNVDNNYNFTLIQDIGKSVVNCSVSDDLIFSSLNYYRYLCPV